MPQRNNNKYNRFKEDNDYQNGYRDGMKDAFERSELDAYYAGVGYGKKVSNDKYIGFNSDAEREEFEKGIQNRDKHFNSLRVEPRSFLEKIIDTFGISARKKRKLDRQISKKVKKPSRLKPKKAKRLPAPKKQKYKKRRR